MKKIVIIDDELYFRKALRKYIKELDAGENARYEVVGDASNGKLGIELIEAHRPQIVLVDITMPQMTGFDVLRYLRDNAIAAKPIIISGYDKFEYAQKAIQLGVQDFLLKPITAEGLRESLDKVSEVIDREEEKNAELNKLSRMQTTNRHYLQRFAASQFIRRDLRRSEMEKLAQEAGYDLSQPWHLALLYHVRQLPQNWGAQEKDLYYFTVDNVFTNILKEVCPDVSCVSFVNLQQSLCLILGISGECYARREEWLSDVLEGTMEVVDKSNSLKTLVCVGGCYPGAERFHTSYEEALFLERKLAFYEEEGIFFFSEECRNGHAKMTDSEKRRQELLQAMRQGRENGAKNILQKYLEELRKKRLLVDEYIIQMNEILRVIVNYAHEYGISDEALRDESEFFVGGV